MRVISVLLVILITSSVQSSYFQELTVQSGGSSVGSSSGTGCSNETHVGDVFHADGVVGNDSWPGTHNCPTKSIQMAVDLAPAGSTIIVYSGIYQEVVSIGKEEITLRAADGERVILDGSESVTGDLEGHGPFTTRHPRRELCGRQI